VHVLVMVVLFPIQLWIFRRGRGHFNFLDDLPEHSENNDRQMNIDYAICNALKYNSRGLLEALAIYDIGCQWIIHFLKRLKDSSHLSIPDMMTLLVGVGKFHLSAHVRECFVKYSLNFIHGAGQLDGEILETLWTPFNSMSKSARTMTLASRQQLYDDHMRDSNWRKIVGIGMSPAIYLPCI
jgi:Kyakuja-Dileera-Zisupton transposase